MLFFCFVFGPHLEALRDYFVSAFRNYTLKAQRAIWMPGIKSCEMMHQPCARQSFYLIYFHFGINQHYFYIYFFPFWGGLAFIEGLVYSVIRNDLWCYSGYQIRCQELNQNQLEATPLRLVLSLLYLSQALWKFIFIAHGINLRTFYVLSMHIPCTTKQ